MSRDPTRYIGNFGIDPDRLKLNERRLDALREVAADFSTYDPGNVRYRGSGNALVATGQAAMEALVASGTRNGIIRVDPQVRVDGAFEGGGAHGLFYLGALHAMAHAGIWFGRVAGTSAGSIAASLIAAGYEIDLNYRPRALLDAAPADLPPDSGNSLNRIILEDNLARLQDFTVAGDPPISGSWSAGAFDDLYDLLPFMKQFKDFENIIMRQPLDVSGAVMDGVRSNVDNIPGIGAARLVPGVAAVIDNILSIFENAIDDVDQAGNATANAVRQNILQDFTLIQPSTWGEETVRALIRNLRNPVNNRPVLYPDQVKGNRALFRLLERGGLWSGNMLRNWLEAHLQAKVAGRSGPGGTVAFRDLPMDLCIPAVAIGRPGEPGQPPSHDQTVFLSKKTSPDFPVAEAVRRSVSLPFAFYPLTFEENHGELPDNVRTPPTMAAPRGTTMVDYGQHAGALMQDGGFRVNLPVGVFRDRLNRFMDDNFDAAGVPKRVVFAFNLDGLTVGEPRPDGVPPQKVPQPLRAVGEMFAQGIDDISAIGDTIDTLTGPAQAVANFIDPNPIQPPNPLEAPGVQRMLLVLHQVMDYATGGSTEQQVVDLLAAAEKTVAINIPTQDAGAANDDNRAGSTDFSIPPITRKWWNHSSWRSMQRALSTVAAQAPPGSPVSRLGVPETIQPYLHQLQVMVNTLAGRQPAVTVRPRAAFGDALFSDVPGLVASVNTSGRTLNLGFHRDVGPRQLPAYFGSGMVWLQTRDADRAVSVADYIDVTVNLPVRVFLLHFDDDRLPTALRNGNWTDAGVLLQARRSGAVRPLRLRWREFPAGTIRLPGPAAAGGTMRTRNYTVLVLPT